MLFLFFLFLLISLASSALWLASRPHCTVCRIYTPGYPGTVFVSYYISAPDRLGQLSKSACRSRICINVMCTMIRISEVGPWQPKLPHCIMVDLKRVRPD